MSNIDMKAWAESLIESPSRMAIPIMTHPGIELCGYTVRKAVSDGEIHAEAILHLNQEWPAAATTVIMDLTVEAEAFGANIVFEDHSIPTVTGRLVSDMRTVATLKVPSLETGRVQQYLKANRLTAEAIQDKPVLAGCIGPFSLAGRLFGMSEMLMAMYIEPETVHLLLEKCTRFITDYIRAIKETGVNGLVIAEPAAGLVSNEDCAAFSSRYIKTIVDKLQDDRFMIILHNCGNTGHCTEAMVSTGAAGFHFGNQADMVEALRCCPSHALVLGNIDPVGVMKMTSAEKVFQAVTSLLEATREFPNYVLSTGCDVPPQIPMENIRAFYDALKRFNA